MDSRFKFCVYVAGNEVGKFDKAECAFFLHDVAELKEPGRAFTLDAANFETVNPNTGTAPVFRTKRDAEITMAIYRRVPVLVDRRQEPPKRVWPVRYFTMFHMTNDSHLFKTREELETAGYYPVSGNRLKRGKSEYVPLYEGKMVQAYDHRAANIVVNPERLHRPAQPDPATLQQHQNADWLPSPQFWVATDRIDWPEGLHWTLGFKEITAPTNVRTMIATALPYSAFGNKVPLLMPNVADEYREEGYGATEQYRSFAPMLLANLNSFVFDFVTRQKVHGQTLNWYIVEQLSVLPEDAYAQKFGKRDAASIVREEVLKLTYTAHDMKPFARDMGYEGTPFIWDEEERRHGRARLDALFFLLYGIDRDDAAYILETFPIVREQDERAFRRYLTKELTLAYMSAFEAGDTESRISL